MRRLRWYLPRSWLDDFRLLQARRHHTDSISIESHLISPKARIGKSVSIGPHVVVNDDVEIGSFSYVNRGSTIHSGTVGRYCSIAPYVQIGGEKHPLAHLSTSPWFWDERLPGQQEPAYSKYSEPPKIGNDVWIGSCATVLQGVTVSDGAVIGAGAVVTRDVPAYSIVAGAPARVVGTRFGESEIEVCNQLRWWEKDVDELGNASNLLFAGSRWFVEYSRMTHEGVAWDENVEHLELDSATAHPRELIGREARRWLPERVPKLLTGRRPAMGIPRRMKPTGAGEYVRLRAVAAEINTHTPRLGTILDVGGGGGSLGRMLRRDLRANYVVVDELGEGAGKRIAADIWRLPIARASVDVVVCSDVLEHVADDLALLRLLVELLAPGGLLVVHTPSIRSALIPGYEKRLRAAEARDHQAHPHVRDGYTEESLGALLAAVAPGGASRVRASFSFVQTVLAEVDWVLWRQGATLIRLLPYLLVRMTGRASRGTRRSSGLLGCCHMPAGG